MILKTYTLVLLLISAISFAQVPGLPAPETRLEKLSRALRGLPASMEDRQRLKDAIKSNSTNEFFRTVTRSYLGSRFFESKLKRNIDELYRFETDRRHEFEYELQGYHPRDALSQLVRKVIKQNLSWDELLLHKEYRFYENVDRDAFNERDSHYYEGLVGSQVQEETLEEILRLSVAAFLGGVKPQKEVTYSFSPEDPRVAGLLTTPRFLRRYANTALNKNRRRAAALFRTLLCDPMVAAIPARTSESEKNDLSLAFPENHQRKLVTESEIKEMFSAPDLHGARADCRACHEKLDPVGQVFGFSASALSPVAAPGALSYRSRGGERIHIPVKGVGELAKVMTEQPDYVSCQVKHFWRWYIGQDVPLKGKREAELVSYFNQVGRRPKDFIEYLVALPEFNQKPQFLSEEQILTRRAVRLLKNCNSCHVQQDVMGMADWDLADLPYGTDPGANEFMIDMLKEALDTRNNGKNREMPPQDSGWKLSEDDFKVLQKWLHSGAPDFEGKKQVKEEPL